MNFFGRDIGMMKAVVKDYFHNNILDRWEDSKTAAQQCELYLQVERREELLARRFEMAFWRKWKLI